MRNIKLLGIAFIVLFIGLVSCNSSVKVLKNNPKEIDVVGNWERKELILLIHGKVIYFKNLLDIDSCGNDSVHFKEDKTTEEIYNYENESGKCFSFAGTDLWKLKGNTLYWGSEEEGGNVEVFQVRRKGNLLKIATYQIVDEEFIQYFEEDYGATDHKFVLGEEVTFEYSFRIK